MAEGTAALTVPQELPESRRRWAVLALAASLFICSQFYRVSNAVIAPELQRELALSSAALGSLGAVFFYAFAAAQVPLALVLDRAGSRWTMTVLSLLGSAGAVGFALARGPADATAARALIGVGMAANLMGSLKLVSQWFPPGEFATLAGVLTAAGTFGNILAATPLALLAGALGWRRAFLVIGAASAFLALLFFAVVRDGAAAAGPGSGPAGASGEPRSVPQMVRHLLASRDFWIISLGTFCRYGTFLAIQGLWAGPYLVGVLGMSPLLAANLLLVLNVTLVVGSPLGGWLSDRVLRSRKRVALLGLAGTAVAELALALRWAGPRPWAVGAVLGLFGLTSAFGGVVYAHVKELMPAPMAGMAMTGVNLFTMFGAAAFLHVMGVVLDRYPGAGGHADPAGFRAAFLLAAAAVTVALALYALARDPPRR